MATSTRINANRNITDTNKVDNKRSRDLSTQSENNERPFQSYNPRSQSRFKNHPKIKSCLFSSYR